MEKTVVAAERAVAETAAAAVVEIAVVAEKLAVVAEENFGSVTADQNLAAAAAAVGS